MSMLLCIASTCACTQKELANLYKEPIVLLGQGLVEKKTESFFGFAGRTRSLVLGSASSGIVVRG